MPIFEPDFSTVRATQRIFDKNDYELVIKKVTGIAGKNEKGETAGVMLSLQVVGVVGSDGVTSDEYRGEFTAPARLYVHNEGSFTSTKRVLMAAFGFDARDKQAEGEFDTYMKEIGLSWKVATEESDDGEGYIVTELGNGWESLVDKHIGCRMQPGVYKRKDTDEVTEQQDFKYWFPVRTS